MSGFRTLIDLVETASQPNGFLPPTASNVAAAKAFVQRKWAERMLETGRPAPADLTGACKYTSLFASLVFGGTVEGNFFHQWVRLSDERVLDLNDDAADVASLIKGELPSGMEAYAKMMHLTAPRDLYAHDRKHMSGRSNAESMASLRPRVKAWAREFVAQS